MTDQPEIDDVQPADNPPESYDEAQGELTITDVIGTNVSEAAQTEETGDFYVQSEALEPLEDVGSPIVSRVELLTAAIELHPDAPANYVLRGELLLEGGDDELAVSDFHKALELAEDQAETANWGYIYRALADRAREGLRRARN